MDPQPVQRKAIPPFLSGRNILVQSSPGTSKTSTYAIGCIQKIDVTIPHCQAVVVFPSRDLSISVSNVFSQIGVNLHLRAYACTGAPDVTTISNGVHVILGTPGRLLDLFCRGVINPKHIQVVILDEIDECYCLGFKDQIDEIFKFLHRNIQVAIFSETYSHDISEFEKTVMSNPLRIIIPHEELTLEGIRQFYINCEKEEWKLETLLDLYDCINIAQAIIYCNTRRRANWLTTNLKEKDFTVSCLLGDQTCEEGKNILSDFRNGSSRILIVTDHFTRLLNIHGVSLIINYDLPRNVEKYIYRIGRGGAYGRKGLAINFITNEDVSLKKEIEKYYSTVIEELPVNISDFIY